MQELETSELLNRAAIAVTKLIEKKRDASSQVNTLLQVLSSKGGSEGILHVQEHLVYQSGRDGLLPQAFCKAVYEDLGAILKENIKDDEKVRLARQYLTHVKRLFKGIETIGKVSPIKDTNNAFNELAFQVFNAPPPSFDKGNPSKSRR